jgi:pyruvate,water dikinase
MTASPATQVPPTPPPAAAITPIPLADPAALDRSRTGGKAAPLAAVVAAGVRVPAGFVVPAAAYRSAVEGVRERIDALLDGVAEPHAEAAAAAHIEALLQSAAVDVRLVDAIGAACRDLFGWDDREDQDQPVAPAGDSPRRAAVAVRSSATLEDLEGASFAGQYDTVLGVRSLAAVVDAVRRCWISYWSARAIEYRRERGLDHWSGAMAVLVQRLVAADVSGVAFTADPASGHRYLLTANAALGLGQGVVDGSVPVDSYAVDNDWRAIVLRHVQPKTHHIVLQPDGGTARGEVDETTAAAPALTDAQLLELVDVAVDLARRFGAPQDVEWAWEGDDLYVLQARPITALPADPLEGFPVRWDDPEERTKHWKRGGDEPVTPLRADMGEYGRRSWVHTAQICGREKQPVAKHVHGYRYTGEIPAFPSEAARLDVQRAFEAHVDAFWDAGRHIGQDEHLPELVASNQRLLAFDRAGASDAALADHLEDAGRGFVRSWTLHWVFVTAIGYGTAPERSLKKRWQDAYRDLTGDEDAEAPAALLEGLPNKLSDAIDRLIRLAEIGQQHPDLRRALEECEPAAFLAMLERGAAAIPGDGVLGAAAPPHPLGIADAPAAIPGAAAFRTELRALLEAQGLRCGAGFGSNTDPLTPAWIEEPALVIRMVRHYLPQDLVRLRSMRREIEARQQERLAAARARVGDDPDRRARFERAYAAASAGMRWFEDHNYHIDSAAQSLHRMALVAAARRLVVRGALDTVDDVRWLRIHEICAALRSDHAPHPSPLRPLVARHKAEHERQKALQAPPWLGAPPPPPKSTPETPPSIDAPAEGEATTTPNVILRGQTGSRGRATGRVRIVPTETPVPDVAQGDVLVATNAGPLWTPVFPTLAAIVLDEGVFSQHAMLTAREYQVPAVFQTKTATKDLQEGQTITVDGTQGLIL